MRTTLRPLEVRRGTSRCPDAAEAARELRETIYHPDSSLTLFHCSPDYDLDALAEELGRRFRDVPLIGCTTAGEITPTGYHHGSLTGVSVASEEFETVTEVLGPMSAFRAEAVREIARGAAAKLASGGRAGTTRNTFAYLLVDGLSMREEILVSTLHQALGDVPLFGGSAGDGTRFEKTFVYHDGRFRSDVALLTLVRTPHPFEVFKTQHFVPSDEKMVVTEAEPDRRIVSEINGRPAGREYARLVGLDVERLTPLIFAMHPVVVKVGGQYYVRSIQKVNADESLTFFCAIDEGIVLTVGQGVDLVENLRELFVGLRTRIGEPQLVLGCDCILRNLELDQKEIRDPVSRILRDNGVVGFSTYGEQFNSMHVNQTFTGVAIGSGVGGSE